MPSSFSSGTRTITVPGHDEYMEYLIRQQEPSFEQYERTPTPTPPPNAGILRKPERPRSAKAAQIVHEPHQCALGLQCTRQIDRFIYHKIKAIHLTGRAMQLYLPVNPYPGGDHTLSYYRNVCESLTDMLGWRRVDPMDVLREIQSPEYWEAEREYLESPGCLAERQKALSAASPNVLSDISSIEASDHEFPHQESSMNGCWQLRQQGGSGEFEVVDSVSKANHRPFQIPLQKGQSRARMSTSLALNTEANSPSRSSGRKVLPTNSVGLKNTIRPIASPRNVSGELGRKQEYTGLGKRKSTEEMAVSDDTAPRKRRLCQARPLIANRNHREVKRNHRIDSSPLEAITDLSQKHQRADNSVSSPVSRSRVPAVPLDRRRMSALRALSAPTATEYDHVAKVRQLQESRQLHRLRKPPLAQSRWDAVASRTRSKNKLDNLDTRRMLQT